MSFLERSEYNYSSKPTLSFLLCCYLHLWYNFSSIFASLLLPDPLLPRSMSAPSITGGTTVPCPMGGHQLQGSCKNLSWEVRGVSRDRLLHPLSSQGNNTPKLPRDVWLWQDEASLCAHLAGVCSNPSSVCVLGMQGVAVSNSPHFFGGKWNWGPPGSQKYSCLWPQPLYRRKSRAKQHWRLFLWYFPALIWLFSMEPFPRRLQNILKLST